MFKLSTIDLNALRGFIEDGKMFYQINNRKSFSSIFIVTSLFTTIS